MDALPIIRAVTPPTPVLGVEPVIPFEPVPVGFDGQGAPIYEHQQKPEPIINARDCELAGFDWTLVLEAAKATAR